MVKRFFVAVILILLFLPASLRAQRPIGVNWHVPDTPTEVTDQLQHFSDLGITHLQINRQLPPSLWQAIDEYNFTVYGKLPINFPVLQTFATADSTKRAQWLALIEYFNAQESVRAVNLFSYGQVQNRQFRQEVAGFIQQINTDTKSLFYTTIHSQPLPIDSLFEAKMISYVTTIPPVDDYVNAFFYEPASNPELHLAPVKEFLETTATSPGVPVFFDSVWLQKIIKTHPDFEEILYLYASSSQPVFPLPKRENTYSLQRNIIVIMLLLVWLILALTYNYNPIYRRSFLRYFTGHKFYVQDVMKRHIRSLFTANSILIQHAISGGIVLYCIYEVTFSALGHQAVLSHYPVLSLLGNSTLALFFWGFGATIIIETISIFWLRFTNPEVYFISQIANLYPWLLQLNLIVATLTSIVLLAGWHPIYIYVLGCLFIIFFVSSFTVTAFDTGYYVQSKRYWYLAGTAGLYLALLAGAIVWIFLLRDFMNVIYLAESLP